MKAFKCGIGYCIEQQTLYKECTYNNTQMLSFGRHLTTAGTANDKNIIRMKAFSFQCKQKIQFLGDLLVTEWLGNEIM